MKTKEFLLGLIVMFFLVIMVSNYVCAQFPDFPPANVTNTQDRDQMLWQLGISFPGLPPKLEDPNAPEGSYPADESDPEGNWTDAAGNTITRSSNGLWNNYDDYSAGFFPGPDSLRVGSYTPIDLLKMKDSSYIISTADEWWNIRRPEIIKDVQEQVWGVIPHDSILPAVTWSVAVTKGGSGASAYIQKDITGTIDISRYPEVRNVPMISATLRTPAVSADSVPVMVVIGMGIDTYWDYCYPQGWGVCIFDPTVLQPDNGAGLTSYLIGLCNKGNWRSPSDWGALAAWSWGISRLIDYFEADSTVDAAKIGVTGHSRYGKAALVAMAYDQRMFIAFPSDAGSLGTKMNRRHWGQDLENSGWDQEYHWTAGNFFKWMGPLYDTSYLPRKIELMPVDAHSLLSLCAPRPVFINGGNQSSWCDPYGMYLTTVAATPAYELLGKQGIIMSDTRPQLDVGYISGDLAYRYHNGGHTDAPDWPSFWQFALKYVDMPTLSVSTNALLMADTANSTASFFITSDTTWSITSSEAWAIPSEISGYGTDTIIVTITEDNPSDTARSAILTVSAPRLVDQLITVNQASANPSLDLSVSELAIGDSVGSTATFDVISNSAWIVNSSELWLYADPQGGINNKTVTLTAQQNTSVSTRTSIVTVLTPGLPADTVTVTQEGAEPVLMLFSADFSVMNPTNMSIGATGGSTAAFWVIANGDIDVSSTESWLAVNVTPSFWPGWYYVDLTAEENPTDAARESIVTVSLEGLLSMDITITQGAGSPTLSDENIIGPSFVYPNPSSDKLVVNIPGESAEITLLTARGEKIMVVESGSSVAEINIAHFSPGIYLLQIALPGKVIVKKIIKK
jgi:hypothetical protein